MQVSVIHLMDRLMERHLDARASATWTLFHGEARAELALDPLSPSLDQAWGSQVRAELPLWVEFAGGRAQLFAGARAAWAEGNPLDLATMPVGPNGAGPSVRASAAVGAFVLSAEAAAVYDGAWTPLLGGQATTSDLTLRAEVTDAHQLIAVRTHGTWAVEAGVLASADTSIGWGDLTWHPGRLVVGGGASLGLEAGALPNGVARVGYDDGCSALLLSAGFSPDRDLPDFGLALQLRK